MPYKPYKSYINSDIIASSSGLTAATTIFCLSENLLASFMGGAAVYFGLSVFKVAMREIVRETAPTPTEAETPASRKNNERPAIERAAQRGLRVLDGGDATAEQRERSRIVRAAGSKGQQNERRPPRGFDGRFSGMDEAAERLSSPWRPLLAETALEKRAKEPVAATAGRRPPEP